MSSSPIPAGLQRIRWIAHCVRAMVLIAMATVIGFHAMFWTNAGLVERTARSEWGLKHALQFDPASRGAGFAVNLPLALLTLYALWCLWRLFSGYLRGDVFTDTAARVMRRMGQSVIAIAIAMPLTDTATILALTLGNPAGQRMLTFQLGSSHFIVLLCGLVFVALGLVLREAQRMAQENAEFI
ncbi:DUF2975 domain-containing protein [Roseateles sp. So40a]|uniref:DUF2975 domain-containing protein n=1 Tax=Roseateles sp. So40a TaxID=3400226 RepID=UPI003A8B5803